MKTMEGLGARALSCTAPLLLTDTQGMMVFYYIVFFFLQITVFCKNYYYHQRALGKNVKSYRLPIEPDY